MTTFLSRLLAALARAIVLPPLRAILNLASALVRPVARTLSAVALVVAAVALAHDLGPITIGRPSEFKSTPMMSHWQTLAPKTAETTRAFVNQRLPSWVWGAISGLLALPTFVAFTLLAMVLALVGRQRRRVEIFAN